MEPNKTFRLTGFSREVNGRPLVFQDTVPAPPICALCGLVPAETYTLTCTHLFCSACFAGVVQKTKSSLHCPVDDKSFRPKKALQPSSKARDYVLRLIVFCFNKTNGCSFFGTVEAMLKHFGGCVYWGLTCQLCRAPVLRSNLVSHVKTAHAKPEKRNVAPRSTSSAMVEASAAAVASESSPVTAAVGVASLEARPSLPSHDLLKTIGELISRRTDEIKRTQELNLSQLQSSIDALRRPLDFSTRFAEFEDSKTKKAAYYTMYDWTVSPFSKIRVGVHYISSDIFMIGPGYKVQLKGCVDGISTVELKVKVTIWTIAGPSKAGGDIELLDGAKMFVFRMVNNNRRRDNILKAYLLKEVFQGSSFPLDSSDGVTSRWMEVGVTDRTVFERDFVEEDSFLVIFCIADAPNG
ncbi:hypothetical protein HPB47_008012 [Ixodes persulcatus]|uniref:Uncharacterized protein n=1 Tax=Ixodes persulcatus TaxID=34615 RepID=A0AC60P5V7_IXOPE|nr:hypothetical protein HPB47_008012 [Ixodes persulcatus]